MRSPSGLLRGRREKLVHCANGIGGAAAGLGLAPAPAPALERRAHAQCTSSGGHWPGERSFPARALIRFLRSPSAAILVAHGQRERSARQRQLIDSRSSSNLTTTSRPKQQVVAARSGVVGFFFWLARSSRLQQQQTTGANAKAGKSVSGACVRACVLLAARE